MNNKCHGEREIRWRSYENSSKIQIIPVKIEVLVDKRPEKSKAADVQEN